MKTFSISLFLFFIGISTFAIPTKGKLTITATTKQSSSPEKAPKNIVAIWIEDANGKFVKTLLGSTSGERQYLVTWKAATILGGSQYNTVDAVTSATYSSHAARTGTWNGTNTAKSLVDDGTYKVRFEVTDHNSLGYVGTYTFTKGAAPVSLSPANAGLLTGISVSWVPDFTGIEQVSQTSLYKVFPNPATDKLIVPGFGVKEIVIYAVTGERVLDCTDQEINISALKKGNYIVKIATEQGDFVQKFTKL